MSDYLLNFILFLVNLLERQLILLVKLYAVGKYVSNFFKTEILIQTRLFLNPYYFLLHYLISCLTPKTFTAENLVTY